MDTVVEVLKFLASLTGAAAGGWAAAVIINKKVYSKPTYFSDYPWKRLIVLGIVAFLVALLFSYWGNFVALENWVIVLVFLFVIEFSTWISVGSLSLSWVYYKKLDEVINILLNWGKVPFIWK